MQLRTQGSELSLGCEKYGAQNGQVIAKVQIRLSVRVAFYIFT